MKKILMYAWIGFISVTCYSQRPAYVEQINKIITPEVALAPLKFLSSDELMGRSPKRKEINIAADYIAGYFKNLGMKAPDSSIDYFQKFDITIKNTGVGDSLKSVPAKN